jgi:putative DNA primase/helicase
MSFFIALDKCTKKSTKKQVLQNCVENLNELQDAGLFFPDSNVVVIDFDGHNTNEKLYIDRIKEKYPHTWLDTDRGTHFYFKKPVIHKLKHQSKNKTTCGLIVDFVCQRYSVIKRDGVVRTGSWDYDLDKLSVLPDWLLPFPKKDKDEPIDLVGLKDGDGRHMSLFTWLARIHARLLTTVDIGEITHIINTMIFAEQLPFEELKNILESISAGNYDFENTGIKSVKQSQNVSDWMIAKFNVKVYKGKIWHKDGLRYISEESLLAGELNKTLDVNKTDWDKILFKLNINKDIRVPDDNKNHIRLDNGVIHNGEYSDIESDEFTPYYLPIFYNAEAYDEHVDKFLNWLSNNDRDMRNVIEEMFGHIILTENAPHAFFLITGEGENGKSTFLNMAAEFTKGLTSYVDIKNFSNPNAIVRMVGNLVNIADDIDPDYIEDSKALKVIANGGELEMKTLYKDTYHVDVKTTLLFTANRAPIWKDRTHGLFRRLNIIHLDNRISDEGKDYELLEKLSTNSAKQYILKLALEGVKRFKENKMKVSFSAKAQETKTKYMIESDHLLYWLEETGEEIEGQTVSHAYQNFTLWGSESGIKQMAKVEFGKRLKNIGFDNYVKKIGGKTFRIIRKI